ncbi:hypothetical protein [uncultured Marinococcus sp.]|jgi:hypothetical protein|nr:hypothetical protein [uncultured Marinococcus sp.]
MGIDTVFFSPGSRRSLPARQEFRALLLSPDLFLHEKRRRNSGASAVL